MNFVVKDINIDYGELQYEYTDAKYASEKFPHQLIGKLAKSYYLLISAGMLIWYLYSLIVHSIHDGFISALLNGHLIYLVILAVIEAIILLSVFRWWGTIIHFAFRHNLVKHGEQGIRKQKSESDRADADRCGENALYIYSSYIVILKDGIKTVLNRAVLRSVSAQRTESYGLKLTFFPKVKENTFSAIVPYNDLIELRNIFSELLSEKHKKQNIEREKVSIISMIFAIIFILVSVALIVLGVELSENLLIVFGLMVLCGGLMIFFVQYHEYPVVKHGLIPLLLGILFSVISIGPMLLIAQEQGIELTFKNFFGTFNYNAVFLFFFSFVPLILFAGIADMIYYLHYRKN